VDALYREHAAPLRGYLVAHGVDAAEDVVQETFLRLLDHAPENPCGWLYTVARRVARDLWRYGRLREAAPLEVAEDVAAEAEHPLEALVRDERMAEGFRILGRLSPMDRDALMRWSECPAKSARGVRLCRTTELRRVERARKRLRAVMAA